MVSLNPLNLFFQRAKILKKLHIKSVANFTYMWCQFPSLDPTLNYGVVVICINNQNSCDSGKLYANA